MKTLLLLILTLVPTYGKLVTISWNANPSTELVTQYLVMYSSTPIILKPDNTYQFDVINFVPATPNPTWQMNVSGVVDSYIAVRAFNGKWSAMSNMVKYSPTIPLTHSLTIVKDPVTNVLSLKYVVHGDVGVHISVEESLDLQTWYEMAQGVIGEDNYYTLYMPISGPQKFFRFIKIEDPNLILAEPYGRIIFEDDGCDKHGKNHKHNKKPKSKYTRPLKHEDRSKWKLYGK